MPLYEYICHVCDTEEQHFVHNRDIEVLCESCGNPKHRLFPKKIGPKNFGFPDDGLTLEHAGPQPVHLATRAEAKRFAKDNNLDLGCL